MLSPDAQAQIDWLRTEYVAADYPERGGWTFACDPEERRAFAELRAHGAIENVGADPDEYVLTEAGVALLMGKSADAEMREGLKLLAEAQACFVRAAQLGRPEPPTEPLPGPSAHEALLDLKSRATELARLFWAGQPDVSAIYWLAANTAPRFIVVNRVAPRCDSGDPRFAQVIVASCEGDHAEVVFVHEADWRERDALPLPSGWSAPYELVYQASTEAP